MGSIPSLLPLTNCRDNALLLTSDILEELGLNIISPETECPEIETKNLQFSPDYNGSPHFTKEHSSESTSNLAYQIQNLSAESTPLDLRLFIARKVLQFIAEATPEQLNQQNLVILVQKLVVFSRLRSYTEASDVLSVARTFQESGAIGCWLKLWRMQPTIVDIIHKPSSPLCIIFKELLNIIWNTTDLSPNMSIDAVNLGCTVAMLRDLETPYFRDARNVDGTRSLVAYLTRGYLGVMNNIVQQVPRGIHEIRDANGVEIIKPFLDTRYHMLKMRTLFLLSFIMEERDVCNSSIANVSFILKVFIDAVTCCYAQNDALTARAAATPTGNSTIQTGGMSGSDNSTARPQAGPPAKPSRPAQHLQHFSSRYGYSAAELLTALGNLASIADSNIVHLVESGFLVDLEHLLAPAAHLARIFSSAGASSADSPAQLQLAAKSNLPLTRLAKSSSPPPPASASAPETPAPLKSTSSSAKALFLHSESNSSADFVRSSSAACKSCERIRELLKASASESSGDAPGGVNGAPSQPQQLKQSKQPQYSRAATFSSSASTDDASDAALVSSTVSLGAEAAHPHAALPLVEPTLEERQQACRCIWTLCFHELGRRSLAQLPALISALQTLSVCGESFDLRRAAAGSLWELRELLPMIAGPSSALASTCASANLGRPNIDLLSRPSRNLANATPRQAPVPGSRGFMKQVSLPNGPLQQHVNGDDPALTLNDGALDVVPLDALHSDLFSKSCDVSAAAAAAAAALSSRARSPAHTARASIAGVNARSLVWERPKTFIPEEAPTSPPAAAEHDDLLGHVMISYNHRSQPDVLRMCEMLKRMNLFRIWLDVDDMSGSTVDAMAEAVENASVFVVCFSEYYKASPNCRAEAMYAFRLKKNIVPVRVQERYIPDGWLGFLIGTELYYDISDEDYLELNVNKLAREIYCRLRPSRRRDSVRNLERKFVAEVQLDHQYVLSEPLASARAPDECARPPERAQLGAKRLNPPPSDMSFNGLLAATSNKAPHHNQHQNQNQDQDRSSHSLKAGELSLKPSATPSPAPAANQNFSPCAQASKWSTLDDSHPHNVPVFSSYASSSHSSFEPDPKCTPTPSQPPRPQYPRLLAAASTATDAPSDKSSAGWNGNGHSSGVCSACASAVNSPRPTPALPAYFTWSPEQVQQWLLIEQLPELLERFSSTSIDGSLLHTMRTVQREAPQCFYEMLRSQFGLELLTLLKFVRALSHLDAECRRDRE